MFLRFMNRLIFFIGTALPRQINCVCLPCSVARRCKTPIMINMSRPLTCLPAPHSANFVRYCLSLFRPCQPDDLQKNKKGWEIPGMEVVVSSHHFHGFVKRVVLVVVQNSPAQLIPPRIRCAKHPGNTARIRQLSIGIRQGSPKSGGDPSGRSRYVTERVDVVRSWC